MQPNNRSIGNKFESIANKFLENKGYKIIDTNFYSSRYGEIDIITEYENKIIFVEVKGRKNLKYGTGDTSITRTKKIKLIKSCQLWFLKNSFDKKIAEKDWQIDVIVITEEINQEKIKYKVKHYKNCITFNDLK